MNETKYFTVNDFAKLSRTNRNTLHYYDSIGLLSPKMRGKNNYRYYSSGQLSVVNAIHIWQELGMTLNEMKALKDSRSPETINEVLVAQIGRINDKIEKWVDARRLLFTLRQTINSCINIDENAITIQFLPAEAIVLGDINDYSRGRNDYDALLSFYYSMQNIHHYFDLNYPVWGLFTEERIKRGDWKWPERYYLYNPKGYDKRPAALYAVGYTRGGYGQTDELYKRLIDYIDTNGFEIAGDAYEEYPLNELCISDESNYLIRILITVKEKAIKTD